MLFKRYLPGLLISISMCSTFFAGQGPGSTDFRYLAVDRSLHEKLDGVLLWMECAQPVKQILDQDQAWEKEAGFTHFTPVSVFRDEQGRYRLYYSLMKENAKRWCAVAFSDDGVNWTKPKLGLAPGKFVDADTNLIDVEDTDWIRGPCIFLDPKAPADERYKMSWRMGRTMYTAVSADGFRFRNVGMISDEGHLDAMNQTFLDPLTGKYTAYCRWWFDKSYQGFHDPLEFRLQQPNRTRRGVSVKRSDVWSGDWPGKRKPIIDPKDIFGDNGWSDLYNPCVSVYQGQYIAFSTMYLRYPTPDYQNTAGPLYPIFMYSRDGEHWDCPAIRHPLIDLRIHTGPKYDIGMAFAAADMLEIDGTLFIYYKYDPGKHHIPWQQRMDGSSVYVASIRKDGFGAIRSYPDRTGHWLTSTITIPANTQQLCVNADCQGKIALELRDVANHPIAGFSSDLCTAITGDSLEHHVHWKEKNVTELAGKKVKLAFTIDDAKIYSFWFEN